MKSKPANSSKADPTSGALPTLLNQLNFTAESVAEAAIEQAKYFELAARYRVDAMRQHTAAEMAMEQLRATKELEIRRQAKISGEKTTEATVEAMLLVDFDVIRATALEGEAEANEEYAKLLLEAFRHRRDALEVVAQLTGAERAMEKVVENQQHKLADTRRKLAEKYPG